METPETQPDKDNCTEFWSRESNIVSVTLFCRTALSGTTPVAPRRWARPNIVSVPLFAPPAPTPCPISCLSLYLRRQQKTPPNRT